MNQWRKQYEEHQLHTKLDEVNALISSASLKSEDEELLNQFNRLAVVIRTWSY